MSFDCYLVITGRATTGRNSGMLYLDRWLGQRGVMEEFDYVTDKQKPELETEDLEVYRVTPDQILEMCEAFYADGPSRNEIMECIQKYPPIQFNWMFVRK